MELRPSERVSVTTLRTLLRGISAANIEAILSDREGKVDTSLIGHRVKLNKVATRIPNGELIEHQAVLRVPLGSFKFVEERCWSNNQEADAVAAYVQAHPQEEFVLTSPFFAQCLEMSKRLVMLGATRAKVIPLHQLGRRASGSAQPELLVSWVVGAPDIVYPSPLDDASRLLEIFCGEWSAIRLFASDEAVTHHPVLNRIINRDGAVLLATPP